MSDAETPSHLRWRTRSPSPALACQNTLASLAMTTIDTRCDHERVGIIPYLLDRQQTLFREQLSHASSSLPLSLPLLNVTGGPSFTNFRDTSDVSPYSTSARHSLEVIVRSFIQAIDCYEDERLYHNMVVSKCACSVHCQMCPILGVTRQNSGACIPLRIWKWSMQVRKENNISGRAQRRLYLQSLLDVLQLLDLGPSPLRFVEYVYLMMAIDSSVCDIASFYDAFQACISQQDVSYRLALDRLALAFLCVGRWRKL